MKVCLVAPPTLEDFDEGPVEQTDASLDLAATCPLGILSLAASAEACGIPSTILDLNRLHFERSWRDRLYYRKIDFCSLASSELLALDFDVLGLSTMCSTYPLTLRIAREVKRARPDIVILLGGPQASVVDKETLEAFPFVDFVLRGEGEETFPVFLDSVSRGRGLDTVLGLSLRHNGRPSRNPSAPLILDLDTLPLPAYHLFPGMQNCRFIPLEIGRGCPFACTFCSTNDFFRRRFRLKSPAKMIEQMTAINAAYGIGSFDLVHDMFTVDRRKVAEFCDALVRYDKKFTWSCSARTDCVDDKLLGRMADAGCTGIFFGVESGSPRMQKIFDKRLDIDEASRVVQSTAKLNIGITVSMIDGFPEEEKDDLCKTVDFLLDATRYDHVKPQINLLAPLAKTPITETFRQQLIFDELFSDMSHHGWYQDPADQELIARYPEIFPNFYGLPSILSRDYLDEFNRFFMYSLLRFRWLIVGLHQISGNLLEIFDIWLSWRTRNESSTRYYATPEFVTDFKRFLRECRPQSTVLQSSLVSALLEYYDLLQQQLQQVELASESGIREGDTSRFSLESVPRLAPSACIVPLSTDVKPLIGCLRDRRPYLPEPADPAVFVARCDDTGMVEMLHIPPLSASLLRLCDGRTAVRQILECFGETQRGSHNGSPEELCLYGLQFLQQAGVIEFSALQ